MMFSCRQLKRGTLGLRALLLCVAFSMAAASLLSTFTAASPGADRGATSGFPGEFCLVAESVQQSSGVSQSGQRQRPEPAGTPSTYCPDIAVPGGRHGTVLLVTPARPIRGESLHILNRCLLI
ncbi:MAG: hypothetical protein H3C30_10345 [Candidatus Hydrogenedentes bacterium]|nr:hypothetical protein [Candidatus Hydrogenedentota bacterium]